ncbi:MAG TPA: hemerythrin domain-containing protein [Sphingobacteriaceae bacterium]
MKRNENLKSLSRDHHYGLLLGWKIRQGIRLHAGPGIMRQYVAYFATNSLFPHFEQEEQEVLVFLPAEDPQKQKILADHDLIRSRVSEVLAAEGSEAQQLLELEDLASRLDAHIRLEEREFFPYLERTLSPEILAKAGEAIRSGHTDYVENFEHEFWERAAPDRSGHEN